MGEGGQVQGCHGEVKGKYSRKTHIPCQDGGSDIFCELWIWAEGMCSCKEKGGWGVWREWWTAGEEKKVPEDCSVSTIN